MYSQLGLFGPVTVVRTGSSLSVLHVATQTRSSQVLLYYCIPTSSSLFASTITNHNKSTRKEIPTLMHTHNLTILRFSDMQGGRELEVKRVTRLVRSSSILMVVENSRRLGLPIEAIL